MTVRGAMEVGVKLLGLYWLVDAFLQIYKLVFFIIYPIVVHTPNSNVNDVGFFLAMVVFYLCLGSILVFRTSSVLRLLGVHDDGGPSAGEALSVKGFVDAGVFILGIYFLIPALLGIVGAAAREIIPGMQVRDLTGRVIQARSELLRYLLQLVLGLMLVIGRRSISQVWQRFSATLPASVESKDEQNEEAT